jgi:hypothetical protein
MVFQDGHAWLDAHGDMRVSIVLNNLVHRGEVPVTIAAFVDPGIFREPRTELSRPWDSNPATFPWRMRASLRLSLVTQGR